MNIKGINVNYTQVGEGKDVILLHGWGQNIEMMMPIANNLTGYKYTIIDFPGFGKSDEPLEAWTIYDYVEVVEELVKKLKIKNPILVGHSFGGRVSIVYASRNKTSKVVLFGSPCIRYDNERNKTKEKFLKTIKKLPGMEKIGEFAKKYIGSDDYKKSSKVMRETFVNIINEDLSSYAKEIDCPTLLIWGTNDEAEPISHARDLEKILKDGALIELEGLSHYAYLEDLRHVCNILKSFF